ncbi:MAG: hypothetical protein ACI9BW_002756 [Gammaproteobacteria bacterium]|jgi:hypothetical protein
MVVVPEIVALPTDRHSRVASFVETDIIECRIVRTLIVQGGTSG